MDRSYIEFRKNCQLYHTNIKRLLKNGEIQKAKELINEVKKSLYIWEDKLKSDRSMVQLLRGIYNDIIINEKRASYKLDRRHKDNDHSEND